MELKYRREYFDACLLRNVVHKANLVSESRPVFRAGRYDNRTKIIFNPPKPHTNYGLHRNPITRSQILYNKDLKKIGIINTGKNEFEKETKMELMKIQTINNSKKITSNVQ